MIQIWKDGLLISVQESMENAEYFAEKNRIENAEFVKVLD